MPRQARLDAPGTLHHVMVRGIEGRRIVDDELDRRTFVARVGELALATDTKVYAWALLTNHAHFLIASGPKGLPSFMRRLLTGYAVPYNLRHRRYGHLFQNRYKSIVCDADSYFTELVRYIHLNPLRVNLVKDLWELERYRLLWAWGDNGQGGLPVAGPRLCAELVWGTGKRGGQSLPGVCPGGGLSGEETGIGRRRVGAVVGGLVGGAFVAASGEQRASDERILGSGAFVERVLKEAERSMRRRYWGRELQKRVQRRDCGDVPEAQGDSAGVALGESAWEDGSGEGGAHPTFGETSWVTAGRDSASGRDIDFGGIQSSQQGAEFVNLVNNVPRNSSSISA